MVGEVSGEVVVEAPSTPGSARPGQLAVALAPGHEAGGVGMTERVLQGLTFTGAEPGDLEYRNPRAASSRRLLNTVPRLQATTAAGEARPPDSSAARIIAVTRPPRDRDLT